MGGSAGGTRTGVRSDAMESARVANSHLLRLPSRCMRPPAELTAAFRERGWKVTPQRQLLFRLLHGNDQHPSAEMLFEVASAEMPGISLRTVYQTLSDLSSMGEVDQVVLGVGPIRFDPNTDDHHHAVCDRCGALRDVYVTGMGSIEAHGLAEFETAGTTIVFHGRCEGCRSAPGEPGTKPSETARSSPAHTPTSESPPSEARSNDA